MKKILSSFFMVFLLGACTPVVDPAKWDPTMYCKTSQWVLGADSWCKDHNHGT